MGPKKQQRSDEPQDLPVLPSDYSIHPKYSRLRLSYAVECRQRIKNMKEMYDKQFLYELKKQEAMQSCAYDAMRFHRHFAITTLWPPLHTRKEVDYVINNMYKLTKKQEKRLSELLTQPQY